jgi:phosphoenolpyruvate carboxykinase (ATP)
MIRAALGGALDVVAFDTDPVFNLEIPATCPGVPAAVLRPRSTWRAPEEYDRQAATLARMFAENFTRFEDRVSHAVHDAGPRRS